MKKGMLVLIIAGLTLAAACGSTPSGKVLVDINGTKITEGDLKFLGEINPRIQAQIENPAGQKRILDNLVEQELLYNEAVKEGVNRDPKVKAKVDLYRRVIIAQSLIEAETDKSAKKYYDEHQDEFKKLKLSHIMVKFATPEEIKKAKKGEKLMTEQQALAKAEEIKARLDKGEEFAKVADETSDDTATKSRGGDLGLVSKDDKRLEGRGFGPLLAKASEMKVGEVGGPIKTDKGYHLIVVTRGLELEPFDEAKQAILFKVRGDVRNDLLARLKKDSKIAYPEEEKAKEAAAKKKEEGKAPAKEGETATPPAGAPAVGELKKAEGEAKAAADDATKAADALAKAAAEEAKKAGEEVKKATQEMKAPPAKEAKAPKAPAPEKKKAN